MSRRTIDLHGHKVAFRRAGSGPLVVLIHGIAGTNAVWDELFPRLAERFDVLAPDLPGHGASGTAAGDYSVGAMAATLRDLMLHAGDERATIVGHSLGGGVAMQFAYLFPELTERLVLVSSGGLGRSVNPILRSAALPGAELVTAGLGLGARTAGALYRRIPLLPRPGAVLAELERSLAALAEHDTRAAFHSTLRAVVGPDGQRVFAGDRLYLAQAMPTLIVWGAGDRIIPPGHGRRAHAAMPGSRLEIIQGAGHFPPLEAPDALLALLADFIETTEPAVPDRERLRALLRGEQAPPAARKRKRAGATNGSSRAKRAPRD
jgi:pimeloyl-ACP methyl ester carboxylesterase